MTGSAALTGPQREVLHRLVGDGVLTAEQGEAVERAFATAPAGRRGPARWLVEIAGYVGGGLMLGGAALFLAASWHDLSRAARGGVLAGFAAALVLAGLLVAGRPTGLRRLPAGPRRRVVGVLFALASVPAALAAYVTLDGYRYPAFAAALVGLAVAVGGLVALPTIAGQVAVAGLSVYATGMLGDEVLHASPLGMGLLTALLGVGWTAAAVARLVPSYPLGLAIGTAVTLLGSQQPLGGSGTAPWAYAMTSGLAVGCLLLYRWQRSAVLLVVGVLAATLAVPEAVIDATNGAVGGSLVLLIAGAVLVAASAVGLRMRREPRTASRLYR